MGPYGITQVDVPGALNALEAARSNRIRQMLLERQLRQEERALETQRGVRAALGRFSGTGAGTSPSEATGSGVAGALDLYGGADPLGGSVGPGLTAPEGTPATPAAAPAATPAAAGHGDIARLGSELLAIDPEHAPAIIQALRGMDEAQFEATQRRGAVLARAAYSLLSLPEGPERTAEFQRIAPDLIANGGVSRQQLAGFHLTDRNLQFVIGQARDIEKLAEEARPSFRNVGPGDVIIDENQVDPATGRPRVVMESPYIRGADGTLYERSPGAGAGAGAGGGGGTTAAGGNNPGGIVDGPFARAQPGYRGSNGRYAAFDTPENGIRAQEVLLRSNYLQRPTTVEAVIERYAPRRRNGGDNSDASVDNYIAHVRQRLGLRPGQTIDISRASELASAIREFETGNRGGGGRGRTGNREQTIAQAREAIQQGAPREAVIERLRGMGITDAGL